MIAEINISNETFTVNLNEPIDISIVLTGNNENLIAWYQEPPLIEPVIMGDWVGKVANGQSSTNFYNIAFNPHAHGTHTECLGHITHKHYSIQNCLKTFFFVSKLITVTPIKIKDDFVITLDEITKLVVENENIEALIIRTLPNEICKKNRKYSNTNPPYLQEDAAIYLKNIGIKHLLIDLPSVDKEKDNGKLLAHKAFWNVKNVENINTDARFDATITELIYVNTNTIDGYYLLNLQIVNFNNDASPSKPVLYKIKK